MATVTHAKGKTTTSTVGQSAATNAASMLAATQASITAKSTRAAGSGKTKADSRPICAHQGCKLHAAEGTSLCSNHRPAHEKMAADDRTLLAAWLTSLTPDERLIAFASVFGPVKSTELARQLRSAGWSPTTPKQ